VAIELENRTQILAQHRRAGEGRRSPAGAAVARWEGRP
jgi:hypothetical protein